MDGGDLEPGPVDNSLQRCKNDIERAKQLVAEMNAALRVTLQQRQMPLGNWRIRFQPPAQYRSCLRLGTRDEQPIGAPDRGEHQGERQQNDQHAR